MSYRYCHRCEADLPPHDEGALIFCTHCGAAQVELSEELKEQAELQAQAPAGGESAQPVVPDPHAAAWREALRTIALAGAIAGGLALTSLVFDPMLLLVWLWAVISPIVVLGLFQARSPLTQVTAGFGARVGLLTGVSIGTALSVVGTIAFAIARRANALGEFDKLMTRSAEQFKLQAVAQQGAAASPVAQIASWPEFRAWMLLGTLAFLFLALLAVTTAGGAFAGFARARKRAA